MVGVDLPLGKGGQLSEAEYLIKNVLNNSHAHYYLTLS